MAFVNLLQAIYPVGTIYCSTVATSPSSTIGGTWVQIKNAALRGTADSTGYIGSDTHVQTVSEMPPHDHKLNEMLHVQEDAQTNATTASNPYWYVERVRDTGVTGGGASNVACPAFLQLLYLVSHRVSFISGVIANG